MLITLPALPAVMIVLPDRRGVPEAMSRIVQIVTVIPVWTGAIMNIVPMDVPAAFATLLHPAVIMIVVVAQYGIPASILTGLMFVVSTGVGPSALMVSVAVNLIIAHGVVGTAVPYRRQIVLAEHLTVVGLPALFYVMT